ncbi:hypothetical protein CVIRNUC_005852 [Coccomyxa viridis]|uniref:Translation initiation factor eIF2B subunit beta n=1 Tax=Coccomyxa viridis TaxID=1274662 RepID=A0AAV1I6H7_9CHLO|nr:hypothetical protein CVIRNUC_005852 [Coccomyxa viridis]
MVMPQQGQADVNELCRRLRRRQVEGSIPTAKATAELLRTLITRFRHPDAAALLTDVRNWGIQLQAAKPLELAVGNIVRRVLHMIREESRAEGMEEEKLARATSVDEEAKQPGLLSRAFAPGSGFARALSLHNLLDAQHLDALPELAPLPDPEEGLQGQQALLQQTLPEPSDQSQSGAGSTGPSKKHKPGNWAGKPSIVEQLNEFIQELKDIDTSIAAHWPDQIHANDSILTFGYSETVLVFLLEAAKKLDFQVVVAEGAPRHGGQELARRLAQAGMHTTLIPDSAIFAMMARVNKVLVGAHALLANGGVMAGAGNQLTAMAAKHHAVPFVVLVGLQKLSPLFPHDPSVSFNDYKSPADVMEYSVVSDVLDADYEAAGTCSEDLHVHAFNPVFDYVPPELVSLLVTDIGGHIPSYVYRLLAEYYSREDYTLERKELSDIAMRA